MQVRGPFRRSCRGGPLAVSARCTTRAVAQLPQRPASKAEIVGRSKTPASLTWGLAAAAHQVAGVRRPGDGDLRVANPQGSRCASSQDGCGSLRRRTSAPVFNLRLSLASDRAFEGGLRARSVPCVSWSEGSSGSQSRLWCARRPGPRSGEAGGATDISGAARSSKHGDWVVLSGLCCAAMDA